MVEAQNDHKLDVGCFDLWGGGVVTLSRTMTGDFILHWLHSAQQMTTKECGTVYKELAGI